MTAPLPPGTMGLPLIGETLAFAKNGFTFVADRVARHGPIFRTSVLGRKTVVISGPDAVTEFIDEDKIERAGAMPPHIEEIFGGRSVPLLDGEEHRIRKLIVLSAFSREALTAYLPAMQAIVERYAAAWARSGEFRWLDEMKKLALEAICTNVGSITDPAELEQMRQDYQALNDAFAALPIPLPGTRYTRAMDGRKRIFALFQRQVTARRTEPSDDGVSRILAAAAIHDPAMDDTAVVPETHHAVLAGFIIFAEFAASIIELTRNPGLLAALREEVGQRAPKGPLAVEQLLGMPRLLHVVMETKRLTPIIPAIFGKAKRTFTWRGMSVPKGWMVMWDLRGTNSDPATYTQPARFDPQRYAPGREEHKRHQHAFTPQGGGPPTGHVCAGIDYSTILMGTFLVVLLRDHAWTLPEQNLDFNWSLTPPAPADGLRAMLKPV